MFVRAGYGGQDDPSYNITDKSKLNRAWAGQKYNHLGSRGDGLKSALDRDLIKRHADREAENFGSGGYSFKLTDEDGTEVTNPGPLNFNGRMFMPSADGVFTVKDHDLIQNEYQKYKEHEEYINKVMNFILVSNNVCELACKKKQWNKIVAQKCTPMEINMMPPLSDAQAAKVVLLRRIIEEDPPIVEGMTTDKVENEK